MSSTTEYAGLLLVDPLGADSAMSGSSWVESQAGIAPTSNMQIIDALLKQKASFTVKQPTNGAQTPPLFFVQMILAWCLTQVKCGVATVFTHGVN